MGPLLNSLGIFFPRMSSSFFSNTTKSIFLKVCYFDSDAYIEEKEKHVSRFLLIKESQPQELTDIITKPNLKNWRHYLPGLTFSPAINLNKLDRPIQIKSSFEKLGDKLKKNHNKIISTRAC